MNHEAFSSQLREAVRMSGISRYKISKDTGIGQATLCRFLQGAWMSEDNLNKLAKRLGWTIRSKP
jgi:predicted transcriptional regulator